MKQVGIFFMVLIGGVFSAYAQDMIVLLDGNIIEARVTEVHPAEIRYWRMDNLTGPVYVIPSDRVLSIRYENGVVDIITAPLAGALSPVDAPITGTLTTGAITPMLAILNALPAIPMAGNNLKFQFGGDSWTATVNGENFSAGTIEFELTQNGAMLTLKQTHIWPGAVGRTAGRVANRIPGGAAVGSALDTAGRVAGAAGAVEATGPDIILEYKVGPPPSLSLVRSSSPSDRRAAAANRFDLDRFNVFAISVTGMGPPPLNYGGGATITLFEGYKPNAFFAPSFFLTGKFITIEGIDTGGYGGWNWGGCFTLGPGVLFKNRFPKDRVLWNIGASLELMLAWGHVYDVPYTYGWGTGGWGTDYVSYTGESVLLGMGIQTGFSFRIFRHLSLDINGLLKFPFGRVDMTTDWDSILGSNKTITNDVPARISYWPFTGGIEIGLTLWFPYRSRRQ